MIFRKSTTRKAAAKRKPAQKRKTAIKPKPKTGKKPERKPVRRKATVKEPKARQKAPCDCEANAELGIEAERFSARWSTASRMRGAVRSTANWRVAKSLLRLRDQVNASAPDRSKTHDGTIGDTNHQNRNSDHNPWVDDGVVTAMDITHDPAGGCDVDALAEAIRAARDSRVKYLIWNHRICNHSAIGGAAAWAWRPYNGANPHDQHLHISVKPTAAEYDDTSDWPV